MNMTLDHDGTNLTFRIEEHGLEINEHLLQRMMGKMVRMVYAEREIAKRDTTTQ